VAIEITRELLQELLEYNPETGILTWKPREREWFTSDYRHRDWIKRWSGMSAGYVFHNKILDQKYVKVCVMGKRLLAHRVIWMLVHGQWPDDIDHINGCSTDNRLVNLRSVDRTTNLRNRARFKNNTSGVTGVVWTKRSQKWRAQIRVNTKQICLGLHADKFDAICARKSAENRYGFHPNHGRDPVKV
jgi:hypothetical protein